LFYHSHLGILLSVKVEHSNKAVGILEILKARILLNTTGGGNYLLGAPAYLVNILSIEGAFTLVPEGAIRS
jgi:hypothetical protein